MKKFSFLIVILFLLFGSLAVWWLNGIAPANTHDTTVQSFTVTKGEGVRQIANNLKTNGLIKDPIVFYFLIKQQHLDGKIQAGDFALSPSMSATQIAKTLQSATNDIRITIPEGKRAEEIADILQAHVSMYQPSWRDTLVANEGYLFPDTYSFTKDTDIDTIVKTMRDNFETKYASIPQGSRSKYSKRDLVIIASMVEREARFQEDRPLVASVIFNRLDAGMPLDLDATVQYAIGNAADWWPTLTRAAKTVAPNSPYNTYTNAGLPPGPISNPGLTVLQAVVNAPETDYLFYVSDSSGHNHYSKTLEEHIANINKYGQ